MGQRSGLVAADNLGAAQRLHRRQPADDGVSLGHVGHANRQHDGDNGGKAFGDGRHRKADRHHEEVNHGVEGQLSGAQHRKAEDDHADAKHKEGENLAELAELSLKGRLPASGLGQHAGNLAHFGVHSGAGHNGTAVAVDHGAAQIDHVFAVA